MFWITAWRIVTKMMQIFPFWDFTDKPFVEVPVGSLHHSIDRGHSVPKAIFGHVPYPAGGNISAINYGIFRKRILGFSVLMIQKILSGLSFYPSFVGTVSMRNFGLFAATALTISNWYMRVVIHDWILTHGSRTTGDCS